MRVNWSRRSIKNLESIQGFIAISNPRNAEKFIMDLYDSIIATLQDFPKLGRIIPEIEDDNYREIIHGNYRIMYRIMRKEIRILTVRNSKQHFSGNL